MRRLAINNVRMQKYIPQLSPQLWSFGIVDNEKCCLIAVGYEMKDIKQIVYIFKKILDTISEKT